ncbi:MAG: efflux RND transporter permease subunit, partial [Bacteriovoracia bacterium]
MIELFVKRPATTIVFILFFMVLGLVSYFNLDMEATPKVDFPLATIKVIFPGATPDEVEAHAVKKIEDGVSKISEIKKMQSYVYDSYAMIMVEFLLGADINVKSMEIKDKVDALSREFPDGMEDPIIEKFDPLAKPVMDFVLMSETVDDRELYEYADKKLRNIFSAVEGVATVDIYGGKIRQINIELDPLLLQKYYLSIEEVIKAIGRKNINIPGGNIDQTISSLSVRFIGDFQTIDEIRNMTLATPDGRIVKISQLGKVSDSFKKLEKIARYNGENAVGMSIINVADGNAVKIAKEMEQKISQVRENLPKDMQLNIAVDYSTFVVNETYETLGGIFIGIILTVLILFFFTGSVGTTVIASVVIPASIVSALFLVDLSNFTINMMTLLAVATSLGTLIANAIVIIEAVINKMNEGMDSVSAAIKGTKEVTVAVLASVGTNLVVFTPIAFMGGIVGQFMNQFGLTVVYATLFSLIASFSLTPMLCGLLLKNYKQDAKKNFLVRGVDKLITLAINEYKRLFNLIFRFPKTTILFCLAILAYSISIAPYLENEFRSEYDKDRIGINMILPQGTVIEKTLEKVKVVEKILHQKSEVKDYFSYIGNNGVENAEIRVNLISKELRKKTDVDVINDLMIKTAMISGVEITFNRGSGNSMMDADMALNVYGNDYDRLIVNAKETAKIMKESGYFKSVSLSYKNPRTEVKFIPDQEKMISFGVPNVKVGGLVRSAIYGNDSNVYKESGEEYDINIKFMDEYMNSLEGISSIGVVTSKGLVSIAGLGDLQVAKASPMIRRRDKERVIAVTGMLAKSTSGVVERILNEEFKKILRGEKDNYSEH